MGLLEKLWDDTVAGPRPDSGLGRLRKFNTFSFRSSSGRDSDGMSGRSTREEAMSAAADNQETMRVTRSITIVRPAGYNQTSGSPPVSPAGDTPPPSPFSDPGRSDSGGDPHQMRMKRRRTRAEPEALLLLTMSEI
uniref:Uncharacterized protein n=1 Tax=Opuntia streptacantha TaxID=393608 RepID=A0A7C8ZUW9_OPUST